MSFNIGFDQDRVDVEALPGHCEPATVCASTLNSADARQVCARNGFRLDGNGMRPARQAPA